MDNSLNAAPLEARFQLESRDQSEKLKLAAMHSETRFVSAIHPLALLGLIFAPAYVLWAPIIFPQLRAPGVAHWPGVLNVIIPQSIFAVSLFYTAAVLIKRARNSAIFPSKTAFLWT